VGATWDQWTTQWGRKNLVGWATVHLDVRNHRTEAQIIPARRPVCL